jgi:hypothetical protein
MRRCLTLPLLRGGLAPEVFGAEDAGGDDRERPGIGRAEVVEPVNGAVAEWAA